MTLGIPESHAALRNPRWGSTSFIFNKTNGGELSSNPPEGMMTRGKIISTPLSRQEVEVRLLPRELEKGEYLFIPQSRKRPKQALVDGWTSPTDHGLAHPKRDGIRILPRVTNIQREIAPGYRADQRLVYMCEYLASLPLLNVLRRRANYGLEFCLAERGDSELDIGPLVNSQCNKEVEVRFLPGAWRRAHNGLNIERREMWRWMMPSFSPLPPPLCVLLPRAARGSLTMPLQAVMTALAAYTVERLSKGWPIHGDTSHCLPLNPLLRALRRPGPPTGSLYRNPRPGLPASPPPSCGNLLLQVGDSILPNKVTSEPTSVYVVLHAATCGDLNLRPATYVYAETCTTCRRHAPSTHRLPKSEPTSLSAVAKHSHQ
ncbi:hypothetical protein DFH09DRAFT_1069524 [Mycena vulgaris]|nr:hypothetical protein DFH09DRAFT_1069524 [Mycena vulgaris]